jgi:hypothetical protein
MIRDDAAEAARLSLLATITRVLGGEEPPRAGGPRLKAPAGPSAPPAPKRPPSLRSAPRPARSTGQEIPRKPLIEGGGGPTSYVPPADGLLGGTERKRRK